MYTLKKATGLKNDIGSIWDDYLVGDMPVYQIFTTFKELFLTVESSYNIGVDLYVDFKGLQINYNNYQGTVNELLIELSNLALPFVSSIPSAKLKYAKYGDAFHAGYRVDRGKAGVILPDNYPESELTDLVMYRDLHEIDMTLLDKYCLVTVNGYVHQTTSDRLKTYVIDGQKNCIKSQNNQLGIISFQAIGALKKTHLTPNVISNLPSEHPLKDRLYFTVGNTPINKSFFLVLGGYIIFPDDNVLWQVSDNTFCLNITQTPIIERFFEANNYIDMSSLGLELSSYDPRGINIDQFLSDDNLRKYFGLSQSFFVEINTDHLFVNKIYLKKTNLPGKFISYQDPSYPLCVNYGKLVEYWKVKVDNQWNVSVQDSYFRNMIISYEDVFHIPHSNDQLYPAKPVYHSRGYLLEIGGYNNPV